MKYPFVIIFLLSLGAFFPANAQVYSERYGIVDYQLDSPGSVVWMTRENRLFGVRYTKYKTICYSGDYMTLFLGEGGTAEEAAVVGRGSLLIGGTGDDAPKIACELVGLTPGSNSIVKLRSQAKPH